MPCTTLLVGKKATNDASTMIARTDDGHFDVKKLMVMNPKDQPRKYKSVISHLEIELPVEPMRYTSCPSVDPKHGVWPACGINAANVGMTATETITTNSRVLAADPLVVYQKAKTKKEKDIPGGIGEEDIVLLVLPYIHSAREGVIRLGSLLEKYGTYESNGIAFNDNDEVWWMETIGGHNWIARRVEDDEYVVMPNQFGLDNFDFEDAYAKGEKYLCSKGLKELTEKYHLDLNQTNKFNPRLAYGSHSDADHVYNTPRAWYMLRYFNPSFTDWDNELSKYNPTSDFLPWSMKPERKITIEDMKYILSSYYQSTPYDPYLKEGSKKGIYRPIGISRTGVTTILQIRNHVDKEISGVEWICFGSNAHNAIIPIYPQVEDIPAYLKNVTLDATTDNFYWVTRLIGGLADPFMKNNIQHIERYQMAVLSKGQKILNDYDELITKTKDYSKTKEANQKICDMAKEESIKTLNKVLYETSLHMKNGYNRSDN